MACAEHISSTKLLSENDQVILRKGKCCQVFQIKKKRFVWLDKVKFTLDGVIGHRYGTTFRVTNGEMVKVNKKELDEAFQSTEQGKDNRGLHDLDSNQKLSRDDIELMKKTGMEGEKIIGQLIENSTTFKDKTEYAQEKWIKKKKKKHLQIFTVLKPTARLLCELYHGKAPQKICHIRIDTLAQILTYSNVRANCNMAVVDTTNGLVVGAVLERLGGHGKVIHFHTGEMTRPALEAMDFPQNFLDNLYSFPLNQTNQIENPDSPYDEQSESRNKNESKTDQTQNDRGKETENKNKNDTESMDQSENEVKTETNETKEKECEDMSKSTDNVETKETDKTTGKPEGNQGKRKHRDRETREHSRNLRNKRIRDAKQLLLQKNMDGLIVACKYHPTPIVLALLDYIAPCRPIVLYSQHKEPLMDCYAFMRERGGIVNFRLTETWLREYQVLPMRTHPHIGMSGGGGYLLTALTLMKPT
ncbi:tRNA (adenine(58)-N(1))-methyltransferase non-catalytic subunit TRM6-like [Mytilus trossulus]|uniref:tRNA (adenine(58)-N(1))-methyltransferase non-catalytic subunit TRM6-like n=1 Tax=Mytilus trossulus TaxID=6551 RepID=UPI003007A9F4